jgi:hypothetical protein
MTEPDAYDTFIQALRQRVQAPPAPPDDLHFDLVVNDTQFSLLPSSGPGGDVDGIAVFGEVGDLPDTGRAEAAIRLLESNLYMAGTGAPVYCCHPEHPGHVVLSGRMPLQNNDPDKALEALSLMAAMVEEAHGWLKPGAIQPWMTARKPSPRDV